MVYALLKAVLILSCNGTCVGSMLVCRLVVNKGCCLWPSTLLASLWFLLLAYIASVVGIHRTRRLVSLSLAYIALAVRIHRTHLLLIRLLKRGSM